MVSVLNDDVRPLSVEIGYLSPLVPCLTDCIRLFQGVDAMGAWVTTSEGGFLMNFAERASWLTGATVNVMDSRARLRMDIGFLLGVLPWPLLKSF